MEADNRPDAASNPNEKETRMRSFRLALVPTAAPNAEAILTARFLPEPPVFGQIIEDHFVVKWREEPLQLALLRRLLEKWRDYHAGADGALYRARLEAATGEFLAGSRLIRRAAISIDDDQEVQGRMFADLRCAKMCLFPPAFHSLKVRPSML